MLAQKIYDARRLILLSFATVTFAAGTACGQAGSNAGGAATSRPTRSRVLVVSIDGLRPDCLLRADAPTLRGLMADGSFSLWATTTDIAITTPSHVSMMTGVTPERHGIWFNGDPPPEARIAVPTLFDRAKAAGYSTALVSGKRKFDLFTFSGHIDHEWITKEGSDRSEQAVADNAVAIVRDHRPDVMLLHFPGADISGHGIGWGTPEQIETIGRIDRAFGQVLDAYRAAGIWEQTYVIVSADHGGGVRTHGKDDPRSRYIPWICVGPGVRKNYDLTRLGKTYEVRTYDTFATACAILGLPVPGDSDGKPIEPMFEDYDLMRAATPPSAGAATTTRPATVPTVADVLRRPKTQP